jgi:hypothetical protein
MILNSMSKVVGEKFWNVFWLMVIVVIREFRFHKNSLTPKKKPKDGVLTVVEKAANRCLARIRILVEHLYAKIKVFKIVAYRYRNRRKRFGLRMALICGIINFEKRIQFSRRSNLYTHTLGSLYETFDPVKARSIAERLELHFTPKHGSWLNIAEIEFAALSVQCLGRRIGDLGVLRGELSLW